MADRSEIVADKCEVNEPRELREAVINKLNKTIQCLRRIKV